MLAISDEQIEQIILKKLFSNYDYLALIADNYDKRWFDNNNIKTIIKISLDYHKKYSKLPEKNTLELIFKKLGEKDESIDSKILSKELETAFNFDFGNDDDFIKDSVIEFIQNKGTYYAILDNLELIEKKKDVTKCIERLEKISGISFNSDLGLDYFKDLNKHLDEISNPEARLSFGFKQFDQITNGGLYRDGRCLMVFMAPTGIGKSLFMSNLAVNFMKQNLFPLIISLEMSELVYGSRIDAHLSKEDINSLQFNVDKIKGKIVDFKDTHKESKLIIKEFAPSSINCNHIQTYIEKLHRANMKPDVLIVDYINLLLPNNRVTASDNSYTRIGEVTKQLRALSYKFRIPVISGTQTNRSGYDTSELTMDAVSESAQILHHSDLILGIYQIEGDRESNRINTITLKNRFGGFINKTNEFFINYKNLTLQDMKDVIKQSNVSSAEHNIIEDIENIS